MFYCIVFYQPRIEFKMNLKWDRVLSGDAAVNQYSYKPPGISHSL